MHTWLLRGLASFCFTLTSRPNKQSFFASRFAHRTTVYLRTAILMSQQHTAAEIRAKRLAALEGRSVSTAAFVATLQQQQPPSQASSTLDAGGEQGQSPLAPHTPPHLFTLLYSDSDEDDDENVNDNLKRKDPPETAKADDNNNSRTSKQSKATTTNNASTTSSASINFRLTTYNVWFGPNGDADPHCERRMKAIARLVKTEPNTWMAGFQEVTDESLPILAEEMNDAGYQTIVQTDRAPYYCVLAVRQLSRDPAVLDRGWVSYRHTYQARGFCYARVELPHCKEQMIVATTHLESWTGPASTGARERVVQLKEFCQWTRKQMDAHPQLKWTVIMGDLNWDDESRNPNDQAMSQVLMDGQQPLFKDAWLTVRTKKSEKCYTYDGRDNPMLGGSMRRRFDRTIMIARDMMAHQQFQVVGTKLIGKQALPGLTFQKLNPYAQTYSTKPVAPSDHFGFVSELKIDL